MTSKIRNGEEDELIGTIAGGEQLHQSQRPGLGQSLPGSTELGRALSKKFPSFDGAPPKSLCIIAPYARVSQGSKGTHPKPRLAIMAVARLSGLQKEVLALYRHCLRESRKKPVVSEKLQARHKAEGKSDAFLRRQGRILSSLRGN